MQGQSVPQTSAPTVTTSATAEPNRAPTSNAADEQSQAVESVQPLGSIHGTVTAPDGNVIVGAQVTLVTEPLQSQRTELTDGAGYFSFAGLAAGTFRVTITSEGFAPWVGPEIHLESGQNHELGQIALAIATTSTTVRAVVSGPELAEEQVHVEEKQRVLGIFPNFYTSYVWNAQPLTTKQKFDLAWRTTLDPVTFLGSAAVAGVQQWQNDFSGYGPGVGGYAKRFGANYTDGFLGVMIGGAVLPSILHQDPRYFYKGTGSIRYRILYAISTVAICKGDNGNWQPNYSNMAGTFAAAAISNAYYPANDRGVRLTIDNALIGLGANGVDSLLQEFLLKKMSRGAPNSSGNQP